MENLRHNTKPGIRTAYPDVRLTPNEWFQYVFKEVNKTLYGEKLISSKTNN